ncbi:MAG: RtcB family protein [Deltaproteobacteria bacterium]|nr:RtcB family protein [Deltaproteobacteria bacterium]
MRTLTGASVPVLVWARSLDAGTERQLLALASRPWVVDHIAAMPDAHVAEGVAVGTVFATRRDVVPAALGGDLGCGMGAVRFEYPAARLDRRALERAVAMLSGAIPLGDAVHRRGVPVPDALFADALATRALERARERMAPRHLGTLGGGNHFVELDRGADGALWAVYHSGSRGLGAAISAHHQRVATSLAGGAPGLAALSLCTPEGEACLADLAWAERFARANRERLRERVLEVVHDLTGCAPTEGAGGDVPHNHVRVEEHQGEPRVVHRKGATCALEGHWGIIPGSMGTATYIVRGRGHPHAFGSCSHGAGRVLTRREARAKISPEALAQALRRVVYDPRKTRDLVEEAPGAYRDLREVLEDQADLVEPVLRLEPIAVVKG